jgi:hypothetical protein
MLFSLPDPCCKTVKFWGESLPISSGRVPIKSRKKQERNQTFETRSILQKARPKPQFDEEKWRAALRFAG